MSCAEAGDRVAHEILQDSVEELALSVKAVVQRLGLCGEGVALPTKTNAQINYFVLFEIWL